MTRAVRTGRAGLRAALLAAVAALSACAGEAPMTEADWRAYEARLTREGMLRAERDPADAPYTNADLVRAFREIVFFDEYVLEEDGFVKRRAPRALEKFGTDVRVHLSGRGVTDLDRAHVRDAIRRIGAATRIPLRESTDDPLIRVMILSRDERRALARQVAGSEPWGFIAGDLDADLGDSVCVAYSTQSAGRPPRLDYLIVIPAEVNGLLRQSCIEEELGQAFGPAADYDGARPSVFNDDEEFALLTTHDEDLLRILYDPRLRPGMTEREAMPLVARIVEELRPGR